MKRYTIKTFILELSLISIASLFLFPIYILVNLAVREINSQGGINGKQIEVIYEDMSDDSALKAVSAVKKLAAQNIDIII